MIQSSDYMEGLDKKKTVKILTQNTMLIPFNFVAPAFDERTDCIIDLIIRDYDIVCLQEVFNGKSQDKIISSWHNMVSRSIYDGNSTKWQINYFNKWYDSFPDENEDIWHPLTEAQSIESFSDKSNLWGVEVSDKRPNEIPAELICSPYYIMGPDGANLNIRQDGGLVILSKYPILECSAMTYSESRGFDKLANKGVLYARIMIGPYKDDYIHVFNTHIQSHGYNQTRLAQIHELMDFIFSITESDKDYARPVLVAGDFNVAADKPDNWMELADIASPLIKEEDSIENLGKNSEEYKKFKEIVEDLSYSQLHLLDSWQELHREDPGFTWIGKDWITGSKNSYGDIGNRVAIEDGEPQRIDYIFYSRGTRKLYIEPISMSLVPDKPESLYCFDKKRKNNMESNCNKISPETDCSFKSYTVSDHLGLELKLEIKKDK